MATPDPIRYSKVFTYVAIVPLAIHVAIFLLWCLFRSDVLVETWIIAFVVGFPVVLLATICLIVTTVRKTLGKRSSAPRSLVLTLAAGAVLLLYVPIGLITAASFFRLSRQPSVDILEAASRKQYSRREVTQFLDNDPTSVNASDDDGKTVLYYAVMRYRVELAQLLIARGADVHVKTAEYGQTALHCAAEDRTVPIIDALIAAGADPNTKDHAGETPLHKAAWQAQIEAVKTLLDHGADVNVTNNDGNTPLDLAADQMRVQSDHSGFQVERWRECVRLLREHGGMSANREQPQDPAAPD